MAFYVYILASSRNGTLYVGMTDDLVRRAWGHRETVAPGFTKTYSVKILVWFEEHPTRESSFARERAIKKWRRAWKIDLIERTNSGWNDLFEKIAT
jgi:putative endonuclease